MGPKSAVTIYLSQEEIASRLAEADPPLTDDKAEISYSPAPGNRGTEIRVEIRRSAVGAALGRAAALVGADPQRQLDDALRRFKQVLETGEVVRSEGSPEGTDARQQRRQRPAEPLAADESS